MAIGTCCASFLKYKPGTRNEKKGDPLLTPKIKKDLALKVSAESLLAEIRRLSTDRPDILFYTTKTPLNEFDFKLRAQYELAQSSLEALDNFVDPRERLKQGLFDTLPEFDLALDREIDLKHTAWIACKTYLDLFDEFNDRVAPLFYEGEAPLVSLTQSEYVDYSVIKTIMSEQRVIYMNDMNRLSNMRAMDRLSID